MSTKKANLRARKLNKNSRILIPRTDMAALRPCLACITTFFVNTCAEFGFATNVRSGTWMEQFQSTDMRAVMATTYSRGVKPTYSVSMYSEGDKANSAMVSLAYETKNNMHFGVTAKVYVDVDTSTNEITEYPDIAKASTDLFDAFRSLYDLQNYSDFSEFITCFGTEPDPDKFENMMLIIKQLANSGFITTELLRNTMRDIGKDFKHRNNKFHEVVQDLNEIDTPKVEDKDSLKLLRKRVALAILEIQAKTSVG